MNRATLTFLFFGGFLLSCTEEASDVVKYQWSGLYGDNILFQDRAEYDKTAYSFQARVPAGQSITIRITGKSSTRGSTDDHIAFTGIWYYYSGFGHGWTASPFNETDFTQSFTSIAGVLTSDTRLEFNKGSFLIEYFENDLSTPGFTKIITVNY